jgi:DNA-binding MarR family transcriptional regulator
MSGPRKDDADTGDTLSFMSLVWGMDHALNSASKRMSKKYGVTGPQRLAIRFVGRHPGIAPGELAKLLHIHPSTLTGVLSRLEERGLVERQLNVVDRRKSHLKLTGAGTVVDDLRTGTAEAAIRRALRKATAEQQDGARSVLRLIEEELGREVADRKRPASNAV